MMPYECLRQPSTTVRMKEQQNSNKRKMTRGKCKYDVNPYYGLISAPQIIHDQQEMRK